MSGWEEWYQRQIQADQFSAEKQQALADSRVLVVGLGGVGSAAALYLALAGVYHLGLCDQGLVEESNLHRQILYTPGDVGLRKVDAAVKVLTRHQPALRPVIYWMDAEEHLGEFSDTYDLVVDCLDNSPARLAVARYATRHSLPVISGGARDWGGFVAAFQGPRTACLGCLYSMPDRQTPYPTAGVMGPVAGVIGTWAAGRVLRVIAEPESLERAEYIRLDLMEGEISRFILDKRTDCPVCSR